jgi:hypothetical protein
MGLPVWRHPGKRSRSNSSSDEKHPKNPRTEASTSLNDAETGRSFQRDTSRASTPVPNPSSYASSVGSPHAANSRDGSEEHIDETGRSHFELLPDENVSVEVSANLLGDSLTPKIRISIDKYPEDAEFVKCTVEIEWPWNQPREDFEDRLREQATAWGSLLTERLLERLVPICEGRRRMIALE